MTNREFYSAIVNANVADKLRQHAMAAIDKLDHANELRNAKPTKKQLENEPIAASIMDYIAANESGTAGDIAMALNLVSTKVTGVCVTLVRAGKLIRREIKIPKVGKRVIYQLAKEN